MEILRKAQIAAHLYTADSIFVLYFNTRGHLTGAKTLYFFSLRLVFYYDYFILSSVCILPLVRSLQSAFNPQSAFYPRSAVCILRFTLTVIVTGVRHLQTADLQTCRLADLQTCRLADLQTCRLADLQTCRLADLQTCRLADLQTCRLADLQTCRPADLQTCRLL